ncbi:MAG: ABC transporter permease, partial [Anaerolineae bacterium]|nr:ABC transporter permease [Anaerolineae bacterium]
MTGQLTFYLKHSLNDLRANRQRTVFALLCIAAGVAAIVGLQTLGELINDTLTGSLREANKGDIHIFSGPESDTPEAVQRQGRAEGVLEPGGQFFPDYFGQAGLDRIQAWFDTHYPGAAAITYQQTFSDLTTGTGISLPARQTEKTFVSSYIVDAARFPLYGERVSLDGVPLRDLIQHPDDIVISDNLADDLGAEIGDTLRLSGASADFTLRGVVSADAEAGVDNLFAGLFGFYYLDLDAAPYFSQEPATYDLYVRLNDDSQLAEIEAAFRAEFPYITVITTQDLKDRNAQISRIINGLVTVMGLVALLIGGIGIANTMLVIVNRRAAEVAILKTVGLEPREVTLLFLTEAILMGIIGSVAGVLSGWLIAFVARGLAESFVAQSLEFRFAPGPALTGLVIGILITAIFGFLPTLAAGRVRPVTVMRPSDAVVPKAGRRLTAVAILALLLALSVLTQGLVGDL